MDKHRVVFDNRQLNQIYPIAANCIETDWTAIITPKVEGSALVLPPVELSGQGNLAKASTTLARFPSVSRPGVKDSCAAPGADRRHNQPR
jgi:hypothetical protein